jgi:hypothetical protein
MTIVPLPKDNVFGPQDIQAMSTALEDVCNILDLPNEAKSDRELLAKKLVALAQQVPRDAALLRDPHAEGDRFWSTRVADVARSRGSAGGALRP